METDKNHQNMNDDLPTPTGHPQINDHTEELATPQTPSSPCDMAKPAPSLRLEDSALKGSNQAADLNGKPDDGHNGQYKDAISERSFHLTAFASNPSNMHCPPDNPTGAHTCPSARDESTTTSTNQKDILTSHTTVGDLVGPTTDHNKVGRTDTESHDDPSAASHHAAFDSAEKKAIPEIERASDPRTSSKSSDRGAPGSLWCRYEINPDGVQPQLRPSGG